MKRTLLVLGITLLAAPAHADITHRLTQSAQISIDQAYSSAKRIGSTYSASGTNVTPSVTSGGSTTSGAIGGLNLGSRLAVCLPWSTPTTPLLLRARLFLLLSRHWSVTRSAATEVTTTTGNVDDLPTYGEVVTGSGGVKSNLAATALSSGIMTVTAGGAGTSAILSNKMELEID